MMLMRALAVSFALLAAPVAAPVAALAQDASVDAAEVDAATIRMAPDKSLTLAGEAVTPEELVARLRALRAGGYEGRAYIRAYPGVPYRDVLGVLNLAQEAGFNTIALVGEGIGPPTLSVD
jgi:biopolymer transport protein ExbD